MGKVVLGAAVSTGMVIGAIFVGNLIFTRLLKTRPVGLWGSPSA